MENLKHLKNKEVGQRLEDTVRLGVIRVKDEVDSYAEKDRN